MGTSAPPTFDELVAAFARAPDPLLLLGEPGVGKTRLVRTIHDLSGRTGQLKDVHTSGLPPELAYAHLAGFAKHSFTGAGCGDVGIAAMADRGTLFIDEIGDAPPGLQHVLMYLLDRRPIMRLGDKLGRELDVRVVAATNLNVFDTHEPPLRRDLLSRFTAFILRVPPLRERRQEIMSLARQFLAEAAKEINLGGLVELSPAVERLFLEAPWPENVRALRAECRRGVFLIRRPGQIEVSHLSEQFLMTLDLESAARATLEATDGNVLQTARLLRRSRNTIYKYGARERRRPKDPH